MINDLKSWAGISFVDITYNLVKMALKVLLICNQDGNGYTHINGVCLLANEQANTLKEVFTRFSAMYGDNACKNMKCIMTDKDLTEREVLKEVFPHVSLFICEFHVFKIFARTITMSGMNITSEQKSAILDLLYKLVKSQSEESYDYWYLKFCDAANVEVRTYFDDNWHPNRDEWTRYSLAKYNFGNYTNNPIESANARMKDEIELRSTLLAFAHSFFRFYDNRQDAILFNQSKMLLKKPVHGFDKNSVEFAYQQYLTPLGFNQVHTQLQRRKPMTPININEDERT